MQGAHLGMIPPTLTPVSQTKKNLAASVILAQLGSGNIEASVLARRIANGARKLRLALH
jgi:hypothetical protein